MEDYIEQQELVYDSILIIRDGYLCVDEYPVDYGPDQFRALFSATKSISSLLVGIAIDQGIIDAVNTPVLSFFPEYLPVSELEKKQQITIEHLLHNSSGFDWDEHAYDYEDERNIYTRWVNSPDRVAFILDIPMRYQPGWKFSYNSAASHLVSAIITRSSGMSTEQFAREKLFRPLGIEDDHIYWPKDSMGINKGGGLCLYPRDLAKIGYLILHDGLWENRQIVSQQWIESSMTIGQYASYSRGFGYHWWLYTHDCISIIAAEGYKEQRLYIVPGLDLIVVITGDVLSQTDHAFRILSSLLRACDQQVTSDPQMPYSSQEKIEPIT